MNTNALEPNSPSLILTVGHSTHTASIFLDLLKRHGVSAIADVRTIPRSRHNPQFNQQVLPITLSEHNIGYRHFPGLGGLRHPKKDSINTAWRNSGFRGFADYMQTDEFDRELDTLIEFARTGLIAMMCAEAVPWRCHRSLIADALVVRNIRVEHILNASRRSEHRLTPFAAVDGHRIIYGGQQSLALSIGK